MRSPERKVSRWPAMLVWLTLGGAALLAACAPTATAPQAAQPAGEAGGGRSADERAGGGRGADDGREQARRAAGGDAPPGLAGHRVPRAVLGGDGEGVLCGTGPRREAVRGNGSTSTLQLLSSGQAQAGFVDAVVMAQAIQKGMDVRMVACLLQQNLFGIMSPADAPIAKPEDLPGKTLASVPAGVDGIAWPIFAKKVGLDPNSVTIIATDVPGKYAALLGRRVDATFQLVPIDKLQDQAQGLPVHPLLYADYGIERLGHGLVLPSSALKDSPDVARGLAAGLAKGWQYAADNPGRWRRSPASCSPPRSPPRRWRSSGGRRSHSATPSGRATGRCSGWTTRTGTRCRRSSGAWNT